MEKADFSVLHPSLLDTKVERASIEFLSRHVQIHVRRFKRQAIPVGSSCCNHTELLQWLFRLKDHDG